MSLVLDGVNGALGSPVDTTTGGSGAGRRTGTVVAGLLAAGHHVGRVSLAPVVGSPGRALGRGVRAGGSGRSRVALVARLLTVGEHVSGVVLALTLVGPGRAVRVVVGASGAHFLNSVLEVLNSLSSSEHLLVFLSGQVGKVVVAESVVLVGLGVVLLDDGVNGQEALFSHVVLSDGAERSVVGGHEFHEFGLLGTEVGSGSNADSGDSDESLHLFLFSMVANRQKRKIKMVVKP